MGAWENKDLQPSGKIFLDSEQTNDFDSTLSMRLPASGSLVMTVDHYPA